MLPTEWVPRTNGRGTVRYVPSVALPPAIAFASDRATANAVLELGSSRALYRGKLTYIASNLYIRSLVGETAEQNGNITYRGVLQSSIDGVTYANVATTTGARAFRTATGVWTGYTPVLARNTWFCWRYLGDAMMAPGDSTVSKVTVSPIVTAKVARSGLKATVYGAATRQRGTDPQRLASGKYVQVATTVMTKAGAFTFGLRAAARHLPRRDRRRPLLGRRREGHHPLTGPVRVDGAAPHPGRRRRRAAGVAAATVGAVPGLVPARIAAVVLLGVAVFQLLLVLGMPWGAWTQGGANGGVLPRPHRGCSRRSHACCSW